MGDKVCCALMHATAPCCTLQLAAPAAAACAMFQAQSIPRPSRATRGGLGGSSSPLRRPVFGCSWCAQEHTRASVLGIKLGDLLKTCAFWGRSHFFSTKSAFFFLFGALFSNLQCGPDLTLFPAKKTKFALVRVRTCLPLGVAFGEGFLGGLFGCYLGKPFVKLCMCLFTNSCRKCLESSQRRRLPPLAPSFRH